MADSSDEFKIEDSELSSDSDRGRAGAEEKQRALTELVSKTAVVPLEKLSEEVTRVKTEELAAHLSKSHDLTFRKPLRDLISAAGSHCGV